MVFKSFRIFIFFGSYHYGKKMRSLLGLLGARGHHRFIGSIGPGHWIWFSFRRIGFVVGFSLDLVFGFLRIWSLVFRWIWFSVFLGFGLGFSLDLVLSFHKDNILLFVCQRKREVD